jgi:toluene monooxygenase system protein E
VRAPTAAFYEEHQRGSKVQGIDWEAFHDPRETTYATYTARAAIKERFVEGLLELAETTGENAQLPAPLLTLITRLIAPLRYPLHGLQMAASYVGSMAPSGRITLAALFQAGDELRRVQRIARGSHRVYVAYPSVSDDARARWEDDPIWQPLRELVERLLVIRDWAEAFFVLNLVVKPLFDGFFMQDVARVADTHARTTLRGVFVSLYEDCEWHLEWSRALAALMLTNERNRDVLAEWVDRWSPLALRGITAFEPALQGGDGKPCHELLSQRQDAFRAHLADIGLPGAFSGHEGTWRPTSS